MQKAEEYLERAAECERCARQARDPLVKRQYEDLAAQWRQLAETAQRQDHDRA